MDDEKKMTLGVRGGEAIPLSVSFFPFSHPVATRHRSLSLLFFRATFVARAARLRSDTNGNEDEEGCLWPPRSRDDCNLHKLSFRFDDDFAGTMAVKKRSKNRILSVSHFRSSRYSIWELLTRTKSHCTFTSSWLSLEYTGNKKKIQEIK